MAKDLRTFLKNVAASYPDRIKTIEAEVDPKFELTATVERFEALNEEPIVFFKKVKGSPMPVIANVTASYDMLALSIDTTKEKMVEEYAKRELNSFPPKYVERAPVKEVMYKGEQADLRKIPWIVHNELDAGPYLDSAITLMRDPDNGKVNGGMYRIQIRDPRKMDLMINPANHGHYVIRKHTESKTPLQVAMIIGHHPAFLMAGISKLSEIGGELDVASGVMGEPLEVVKGETVDLPIPARAEVVIEGVIEDPTAVEEEGPFGEWPKYYSGKRITPWITPTAIYMRKDAIFEDIIAAHNEHTILGALPRMGSILHRVKGALPTVKAVNLPVSGCGRCHLYISLKKGAEGETKQAAFEALAADPNIKLIICVDDDVNVFNEEEVLWALATRFQADKGLIVMPNCIGSHLNPSAYDYTRTKRGVMETKLILDATRPLPPIEFPPKATAPAEVYRRLTFEKLQVKGIDPDLTRRLNLPAS